MEMFTQDFMRKLLNNRVIMTIEPSYSFGDSRCQLAVRFKKDNDFTITSKISNRLILDSGINPARVYEWFDYKLNEFLVMYEKKMEENYENNWMFGEPWHN